MTNIHNEIILTGLESSFERQKRQAANLKPLVFSPRILVDTMRRYTSPERLARASVLIHGGYESCQYRVSLKKALNLGWSKISL